MSESRLHRCGRLLLALQGRPALTTAEAAALLGVSRATALRDLAALVEADLGVEVAGEGSRRRYQQACAGKFAVTFGQRLALLFGQQMMGFLEGTLIEGWLGELAANLDPALVPGAGADARKLVHRLHYLEEPARHYESHDDTVNTLLTALLKDLELAVEYEGRGCIGRFRAYTLIVYRRALYVLGEDAEQAGVITLSVDRIQDIRLLGATFRPRRGFSATEIMADYFGIWRTPAPEDVVLRFPSEKARLVRARRWHRSGHLVELADGRIELRMHAGGRELVSFVLEWGAACEVVEPAWLRAEVQRELAGALALYAEPEGVECARSIDVSLSPPGGDP